MTAKQKKRSPVLGSSSEAYALSLDKDELFELGCTLDATAFLKSCLLIRVHHHPFWRSGCALLRPARRVRRLTPSLRRKVHRGESAELWPGKRWMWAQAATPDTLSFAMAGRAW